MCWAGVGVACTGEEGPWPGRGTLYQQCGDGPQPELPGGPQRQEPGDGVEESPVLISFERSAHSESMCVHNIPNIGICDGALPGREHHCEQMEVERSYVVFSSTLQGSLTEQRQHPVFLSMVLCLKGQTEN